MEVTPDLPGCFLLVVEKLCLNLDTTGSTASLVNDITGGGYSDAFIDELLGQDA
jgi:hypothetical protein